MIEATIAVNKDYCILCGACVNACPGEDIIVLQRTGIRMKGTETDLFKKIKEKLFTKRTSKVKEEHHRTGRPENDGEGVREDEYGKIKRLPGSAGEETPRSEIFTVRTHTPTSPKR